MIKDPGNQRLLYKLYKKSKFKMPLLLANLRRESFKFKQINLTLLDMTPLCFIDSQEQSAI